MVVSLIGCSPVSNRESSGVRVLVRGPSKDIACYPGTVSNRTLKSGFLIHTRTRTRVAPSTDTKSPSPSGVGQATSNAVPAKRSLQKAAAPKNRKSVP